ncbi:Crp/Fnr family transcriptional regulator [Mangrovimonas sp. TPBH4]|uniref:Crp/Fnr family transcriptional regulator n=1 Tax=Mangrovimonas sp. TPBH4 TaxID=1645914 RepID=UPI0006B671A3|nr:Crp/Fnr family transcriptional regulator [Mangrovimonas sp. TPBH4]
MNTIWFFEDVNLFKLLCPHKYKNFKKSHQINHYNKKDFIYFEEDSSNKVFLIERGKVKIGYYTESGDEIVKSILLKGELFGEKAILGEEKRSEFAQCIENDTTICPVGVDTMYGLMRDNRSFSFRVYKIIGFRLKKLERRLQLLMFKDSKTRLLEFLEELCDDYGYDCQETELRVIKHPYTQKDIATLIGVSRPTLNILMNDLKEKHIIDFGRKEIKLLKKLG